MFLLCKQDKEEYCDRSATNIDVNKRTFFYCKSKMNTSAVYTVLHICISLSYQQLSDVCFKLTESYLLLVPVARCHQFL